jgi:hypothetical protein
MASKFEWNKDTKLEDLPQHIKQLIPSGTCPDELDSDFQVEHVRFRVQHEIDITDEEGPEETGITPREYRNAKRFLRLTNNK